jgi:hypothetical protein
MAIELVVRPSVDSAFLAWRGALCFNAEQVDERVGLRCFILNEEAVPCLSSCPALLRCTPGQRSAR